MPGTIHATACSGHAALLSSGDVSPCSSCISIGCHKNFKNVLRVPKPADKNYKYINKEYQNKGLALLYANCAGLRPLLEDEVSMVKSTYSQKLTAFQAMRRSPIMQYVKGVLSGDFKGYDFFGSLLQGVVLKRNKEQ